MSYTGDHVIIDALATSIGAKGSWVDGYIATTATLTDAVKDELQSFGVTVMDGRATDGLEHP